METFQNLPNREAPSSESDLFFKEGLGRQIGTVALEAHQPHLQAEPVTVQESENSQTQAA